MSQEESEFFIPSNSLVKLTTMGHLREIQYMEKMNTQTYISKLNKHQYVVLETGEIKEFKHIENRSQSYNSLRQTFKKIRYLINNNFHGHGNELHVVLTYEKNITDNKVLYADFKRFMTRLKRKYEDVSSIDYINVVEPQGRGAWHCHLLLRFNDLDSIFIPNEFDAEGNPVDAPLYDMWGQGFVTIKSLKDVDNIGAYLSAYLADLELTDDTFRVAVKEDLKIVEREVEGETKRFIKGGRLHMYPPGMNLYRKSRGVKFPERETMTYKEAKKIVGSAKPHYSNQYEIEVDDFSNTVAFEQYNSKRL